MAPGPPRPCFAWAPPESARSSTSPHPQAGPGFGRSLPSRPTGARRGSSGPRLPPCPDTPAVRTLAVRLEIKPSTLMSRFTRSGLPSPKNYLAAIRLLYAAQYFEGGGRSVADVAYRLDCSSPQSFGRTLRAMLGITPGEFRRRFPFPTALERFLAQMVEPYQRVWAGFHPLKGAVRDKLSAFSRQPSATAESPRIV